jgi:probable F420-dependent oxidoreductase
MMLNVPLPGNQRIPPHPKWILRLQAPDYQRIVHRVDELGYEVISTSEHFVMPHFEVPRLGSYWTHALTVMAFTAGATRSVRVDATVLVLPYHHPVALAKVISTLDVLSGGRVNLSIGVGHAVKEFEILGLPFSDRGRMTDEALEVMKHCWTNAQPNFKGDYFHIDGVTFEPAPVQQPLPIFVGGNSKAALRRAARHQGWQPNPVTLSAAEMGPSLEYIQAQPEFAGKESTFDVMIGLGMGPLPFSAPVFGSADSTERAQLCDQLVEAIQRLASYGATSTLFPAIPTGSLEDYLEALAWFAEEVRPHLA